ncbi:hypothetical protein [Phycicoccus flavus]|uniref:DNA modification methylase n=1 Tax=Phycicoccus flavus TaxID=2502783 RepID=A0A8T6R1I0_9MICO|nr:hypothetical protein [Phycicoccus flavus]NHA66655.1 hypothetical protein [Phycicoccus flavus]
MTNRAATFLRLLGLAGATLVVSACGVFSPVQTDYPYIPADGVDLTMPGLDLRNLAVVTDAEGSAGVLVGQAVNEGAEAVEVTFALSGDAGGRGASTTVPAYSGSSLSETTPVTLAAVPAAPGALVELSVTTAQAGRNVVEVPVLDRTSYYTSVPTPSQAPSSSASPSASTSPSASPSPSASSSG